MFQSPVLSDPRFLPFSTSIFPGRGSNDIFTLGELPNRMMGGECGSNATSAPTTATSIAEQSKPQGQQTKPSKPNLASNEANNLQLLMMAGLDAGQKGPLLTENFADRFFEEEEDDVSERRRKGLLTWRRHLVLCIVCLLGRLTTNTLSLTCE